MKKRIAILGSTGSIGTQTLDVIAENPDRFVVEGLAAGHNVERLLQQIQLYRPRKVSVATRELAEEVRQLVAKETEVYYGPEGLIEIAAGTDADYVVTAVVGSQGLKPTLAAIEAGKTIGLANKETLVSAGHLVRRWLDKYNGTMLPIDSEHSAIFQCLNGENRQEIAKIILTASGGSFRDKTRDELKAVTLQEALRHPNWSMGAKITIDSATMVNKGLEVIEARWLFDVSYEQIEVLLHPESIIHSMVEFKDHSVIAQLGQPDMRTPIQYALSYPQRLPMKSSIPLRLADIGTLNFRTMDQTRYPCLRMAFESGRIGGTAPTAFNAANEVAVARFIRGEITFLQIEEIIERIMEHHMTIQNPELDQIIETDHRVRLEAGNIQFIF